MSGMSLSPPGSQLTAVQGQLLVPMVPRTVEPSGVMMITTSMHVPTSATKDWAPPGGHLLTTGVGVPEKELH